MKVKNAVVMVSGKGTVEAHKLTVKHATCGKIVLTFTTVTTLVVIVMYVDLHETVMVIGVRVKAHVIIVTEYINEL